MPIQDTSLVPGAARTPVWWNGSLIDWSDAVIHMATHVINYGCGVFEGVRFYKTDRGPAIFHLDAHLGRLQRSMRHFGIASKFSIAEIKQACVDVARSSGASAGYLRPQVQFGLSKLSLGATTVVDTSVLFWPMGKYREVDELNVITSEVERVSPRAVNIEAKVIGYYTNSHTNHEFAKARNADEAIMLDIDGNVAEASSANVFCVRGEELLTPEPGRILRGITRGSVLELARKELELPTRECVLTPDDLRGADEIFLTGTAAEIDPVTRYDGFRIGAGGKGPLTSLLQDCYQRATVGTLPGYDSWNTYVE